MDLNLDNLGKKPFHAKPRNPPVHVKPRAQLQSSSAPSETPGQRNPQHAQQEHVQAKQKQQEAAQLAARSTHAVLYPPPAAPANDAPANDAPAQQQPSATPAAPQVSATAVQANHQGSGEHATHDALYLPPPRARKFAPGAGRAQHRLTAVPTQQHPPQQENQPQQPAQASVSATAAGVQGLQAHAQTTQAKQQRKQQVQPQITQLQHPPSLAIQQQQAGSSTQRPMHQQQQQQPTQLHPAYLQNQQQQQQQWQQQDQKRQREPTPGDMLHQLLSETDGGLTDGLGTEIETDGLATDDEAERQLQLAEKVARALVDAVSTQRALHEQLRNARNEATKHRLERELAKVSHVLTALNQRKEQLAAPPPIPAHTRARPQKRSRAAPSKTGTRTGDVREHPRRRASVPKRYRGGYTDGHTTTESSSDTAEGLPKVPSRHETTQAADLDGDDRAGGEEGADGTKQSCSKAARPGPDAPKPAGTKHDTGKPRPPRQPKRARTKSQQEGGEDNAAHVSAGEAPEPGSYEAMHAIVEVQPNKRKKSAPKTPRKPLRMAKQTRQQVLRDLLLCPDHLAGKAFAALPAYIRERAQTLRAGTAHAVQALLASGLVEGSEEPGPIIQRLLGKHPRSGRHKRRRKQKWRGAEEETTTSASEGGGSTAEDEASSADEEAKSEDESLPASLVNRIELALSAATKQELKDVLVIHKQPRLVSQELSAPIDLANWNLKRIIAHTQAWDRGNAADERHAKEQAKREALRKEQEAGALRLENGEGAGTHALLPAPVEPPPQQEPEPQGIAGPRVQVGADGRIVIVEESLTVEAHQKEVGFYQRVEEGPNRSVNASTYMKIVPKERWSESDTALFYRALRIFGTDFTLVSHIFPARDRRNIKNKFTKEERENPEMVTEALHRGNADPEEKKLFMSVVKARIQGLPVPDITRPQPEPLEPLLLQPPPPKPARPQKQRRQVNIRHQTEKDVRKQQEEQPQDQQQQGQQPQGKVARPVPGGRSARRVPRPTEKQRQLQQGVQPESQQQQQQAQPLQQPVPLPSPQQPSAEQHEARVKVSASQQQQEHAAAPAAHHPPSKVPGPQHHQPPAKVSDPQEPAVKISGSQQQQQPGTKVLGLRQHDQQQPVGAPDSEQQQQQQQQQQQPGMKVSDSQHQDQQQQPQLQQQPNLGINLPGLPTARKARKVAPTLGRGAAARGQAARTAPQPQQDTASRPQQQAQQPSSKAQQNTPQVLQQHQTPQLPQPQQQQQQVQQPDPPEVQEPEGGGYPGEELEEVY